MASLAFLLVAVAGAGETPPVHWIGSWEAAFRQATETGKPIMICINSKDGERANETTAREIYRDPAFVDLSRRFVMVLISTREHATEGVCPRFGRVSCRQHRECWKELKARHGEQFVVPHTAGDMISPQHAWFAPDGTLLRRREYFLDKSGLMKRMKATLSEMKRARKAGAPEGAPGAGVTLDAADRAELERLRNAGDHEVRAAALGNLLGTDKAAVRAALGELLQTTEDEALKRALLRALARARVHGVRPTAEKLLGDRDAAVRSCAAVALEELAQKESIPALLKRGKLERDATARKNVYRALGACGGPSADKAAAKTLLKAAGSDKQRMVCKHAALALRSYAGAGAELVRRRLERAVLHTKDKDVSRAIVYVLAYVGVPKTTVPVLRRVLDKAHEDWAQAFVRGAIRKIEGASDEGAHDKFGDSARWLFWEDREDPARTD
ncbi:MAG: HEAT repeat domain-containing protein [Planctomycetota bacterium]